MGKFDIDETIKGVKRIMKAVGSWPERSPTIMYKRYGYVRNFLLTTLTVTILIEVFNNLADLGVVSFGICCSLSLSQCIVSHWIVTNYKSKFFKILDSLKEPVLALHEDHLSIYLQQKVRFCATIRPTVLISSLGTGLIGIVSPMFAKSERALPVPFPIDLKNQPLALYYFIWCFQSVSILFIGFSTPCIEGLIFTFLEIAVGQLRILRERIVNAANCCSGPHSGKQNTAMVKNVLKQCVVHHVAIERYIATIEDACTIEFLVQLMKSLLLVCITGFNFILLPVMSVDFGRCFFFFLSALIQLIFYCVPGNEIILQSEQIRDACYMSEWLDCDESIRKTLFIIMERSKRPFALTAARFTELSLETLIKVLKSSFSYYTVLKQLYANSRQK